MLEISYGYQEIYHNVHNDLADTKTYLKMGVSNSKEKWVLEIKIVLQS